MLNFIDKLCEQFSGVVREDMEKIVKYVEENVKSREKEKIIINGDNRSMLDGYVTNLKYNAEKRKLFFKLVSASTSTKSPGEVFYMNIPVFFYNAGADELSRRVRDGMYAKVEGKLRGEDRVIDIEDFYRRGIKYHRYVEYKIIGTHVKGSENIKVAVALPENTQEAKV